MARASLPEALKFTYEDYLLLPEDKRYEIIDGELFMTPSPSSIHQTLVLRLASLLDAFVRKKRLGRIFIAPYDVVFSRFDILQPDILFVSTSNIKRITDKNLQGPPDLIVEVISPGQEQREGIKKKVYAGAGVQEYWIVFPEEKEIEVYELKPSGYELIERFGINDRMSSRLLGGLDLSLNEVFD